MNVCFRKKCERNEEKDLHLKHFDQAKSILLLFYCALAIIIIAYKGMLMHLALFRFLSFVFVSFRSFFFIYLANLLKKRNEISDEPHFFSFSVPRRLYKQFFSCKTSVSSVWLRFYFVFVFIEK